MTQKRNYKQYPKEFKEEAVALITEQGYTVAKAAEACSGLMEQDTFMRDNIVNH